MGQKICLNERSIFKLCGIDKKKIIKSILEANLPSWWNN